MSMLDPQRVSEVLHKVVKHKRARWKIKKMKIHLELNKTHKHRYDKFLIKLFIQAKLNFSAVEIT